MYSSLDCSWERVHAGLMRRSERVSDEVIRREMSGVVVVGW